ncbi:MAG TPA: hypothetical protein VGW78_07680 [Candidatus Babeliales bacterium]|jgi:hypothetical protein|nr:hypothetical protein [Candidatus Babeliales bacterium]
MSESKPKCAICKDKKRDVPCVVCMEFIDGEKLIKNYKKLLEFVNQFTCPDWPMTPDVEIGREACQLLKEIGEA